MKASNLEQTYPVVKDLSEQPESKYILIIGGDTPRYYAVDYCDRLDDDIIEFNRVNENDPVVVCRVKEGQWSLIRRDITEMLTVADMTRASIKNMEAAKAFRDQLVSEGILKASDELKVEEERVPSEDEERWIRAAYR